MRAVRRNGTVRAGFSLAELMVVVVIISLLATFVATNAMKNMEDSRRALAEADIASICSALDTYAVQNGGRYPDSLEELVRPDENGETYLKDLRAVPVDPWGHTYVYETPASASPLRVASFGRDGQPGGEGRDADLDNFTMRARPRRSGS